MTLKEKWENLDDFQKFTFICLVLLTIGFIAVHIIGELKVGYGVDDFFIELIRGT